MEESSSFLCILAALNNYNRTIKILEKKYRIPCSSSAEERIGSALWCAVLEEPKGASPPSGTGKSQNWPRLDKATWGRRKGSAISSGLQSGVWTDHSDGQCAGIFRRFSPAWTALYRPVQKHHPELKASVPLPDPPTVCSTSFTGTKMTH